MRDLCAKAVTVVIAAFVSGCSGYANSSAAVPKTQNGNVPSRGGSWMRPDAISNDLAYVGSEAGLYVFSYPNGALVGAIDILDMTGGLCVDANQDVFVPEYNGMKIVEFAHGNSYSIATVSDAGFYPEDCAIDPSTGNLAVMNIGAPSFAAGNIAVYQNAQGSPTYYSDPNIAHYEFGSYDQSGNLYVDGYTAGSPEQFRLAELPKGQNTFTDISLPSNVLKRGGAGLFWDGDSLAISNGRKKVYRLKIVGSVAKNVGTTTVTEGALGAIWIRDHRLLGGYEASAGIWPYPKGGSPLEALPVQDYVSGVAVSAGKSTLAYKTVYAFQGGHYGPDGVNPGSAVVADNGILYGTTIGGGATTWGTVYGVTPSGSEVMLYNFHGTGDASTPFAGLTELNGTFYGTAIRGGAVNDGAVFAITPSGAEHIVYSGDASGSQPYGGLIVVKGKLYGTMLTGGNGYGTVFSLTPNGKEKTLYTFKGGSSDGANPQANLTYANGYLYGTTNEGGSANDGTAFKMSLSGKEQFVYSFRGGHDGENPESSLIDMNGVLYGTTLRGGNGYGTVYSLSESGSESIVYAFKGKLDGAGPIGALAGINGTLYGTASGGGFNLLNGTIFELTTSGDLTVLHSFRDFPDGANPESPLTLIDGRLYGTAVAGGDDEGCPGYGCGTIFRFKPQSTSQ